MNHERHYKHFLDYNGQEKVWTTKRDRSLNYHYVYRVIATHIDGVPFYSISPHLTDFKMANEIEETLLMNKESMKYREFFRMTLTSWEEPQLNMVKTWTLEDLENSIKNLSHDLQLEMKARHLSLVEEGRRFVIEKNKEVIGYSKISDIVDGGGNIVVYVNDKYRHQGYGKMLVSACVTWCIKRDILPIYLVDVTNQASIRLAKSIGFRTFSKEFVLSEEI